ncbi:MAG: cell division protein FtsQ [Bacteroidia bacterium]
MDKEQRIQQLKKIGIISLWVLLVSGLLVSLGFVQKSQGRTLCLAIDISISPEAENFFIDRAAVVSILTNEGKEDNIVGEPVHKIDVAELEARLERNPFVYNAEVYANLNGQLKVDVYQRRPIVRIIRNDGTGYYIDNRGLKMPVSDSYTARVLVATGNIYEKYSEGDSLKSVVTQQLFELATFLEKDEFWKAQMEQVLVNDKSELILIPKVGDHQIILGTTEGLEEKLNRLMLFYKEALTKTGWNQYGTINLKYTGQIVCTKK